MNDEEIIWLYNKVLRFVKNNFYIVIMLFIMFIIVLIILIIRSIYFDKRLIHIEKLIYKGVYVEIEEKKNGDNENVE